MILEYKLDFKSRGNYAQNSPFISQSLGYKTIRDAVYVCKSQAISCLLVTFVTNSTVTNLIKF